jgi:hypothetical protein
MQTSGRALDPLASSITTTPVSSEVVEPNTKTLGNISQNNIKQKKKKNQLPTSSKSKQRELSILTFTFSCLYPRSHGPS